MGHGWPKLAQFSVLRTQFPDPLGIGSTPTLIITLVIEVFCPILIILGLATRINSALVFLLLMTAASVVHATDPWNTKEFAIIYAIPFFVLIFTGGGNYSIDQKKNLIF